MSKLLRHFLIHSVGEITDVRGLWRGLPEVIYVIGTVPGTKCSILPLIIADVTIFFGFFIVLFLCSLPRAAEAGSLFWIPYYHYGLDFWLRGGKSDLQPAPPQRSPLPLPPAELGGARVRGEGENGCAEERLSLMRLLSTVRGGSSCSGRATSRFVPALVPRLWPARAAAGCGHRRRHHHAPQHLPTLVPGQGEQRGPGREVPAPLVTLAPPPSLEPRPFDSSLILGRK